MPAESHLTLIAKTIQLSVAPVFLLTAIGTMLAVLTGRLNRIVDRARVLEEHMASLPAKGRGEIRVELLTLSRRSKLINVAITLGTICALLICSMIAAMFTQQVQKYSLQVLPQPRFHWVKKRSRHCCMNSPLVTFGPPLLKGAGGISDPGFPRKSPLSPLFQRGEFLHRLGKMAIFGGLGPHFQG